MNNNDDDDDGDNTSSLMQDLKNLWKREYI